MKDPAYLFYSQDFYTGVATMTFEDRGKYISILCLMHQQGRMTEETIRFVVGSVSVNLKSKFKIDENGFWYNERLEIEIEKRKNFVASRINNGKLGGRPKEIIKPLGKPKQNRKVNLPENENRNEDEDIIIKETYKNALEIYFTFYESQVGAKPTFNAGQGANLKRLMACIKTSLMNNQQEANKDNILSAWSILLQNLPDWYKKHLDINIIYSKYDGIITEIRKKTGSSEKDFMQDIISRRKREREATIANS